MQQQRKKYHPLFLWLILSFSVLGFTKSGTTLTEALHAIFHLFDHHHTHHHFDHQLSEQGHTHALLDLMTVEHHRPSALPVLPSDDFSQFIALLNPDQGLDIDLSDAHLNTFELPNHPRDRYLEHRGPPPKLTFTDISIAG